MRSFLELEFYLSIEVFMYVYVYIIQICCYFTGQISQDVHNFKALWTEIKKNRTSLRLEKG